MQQGSARPWAVKYMSDHGRRQAAQARSSCRLRLRPRFRRAGGIERHPERPSHFLRCLNRLPLGFLRAFESELPAVALP